MKIKFYNLGTIKESELDLRPLTIIIGPNNSNKTYLAYSVYGLLQLSSGFNSLDSEIFHRQDKKLAADVQKGLFKYVNATCIDVCTRFASRLEMYYQDSSRSLFANTKFELQPSYEEVVQAVQRLTDHTLEGYHGLSYQLELVGTTLFARTSNVQIPDEFSLADASIEVHYRSELLRTLFFNQVLLPAERNAFIITYKMLLNKRFSLLRDRERRIFGEHDNQELQLRLLREQGDIRYPQPIEDFLDMLSDIELSHGKTIVPKSAQSNGQNGTASKK